MKNKRTIQIDEFKDVTVTTRHINSQKLAEDAIIYISESMNNLFFQDLKDQDDRDRLVSSIEYYGSIMADRGEIELFDVVFDKRNNKQSDIAKGKFNLEFKFKQMHCLNFSSILFEFGYNG